MIHYASTILPTALITILIRRLFDSFVPVSSPADARAINTCFNALSAPAIAATTGVLAYGWKYFRRTKIKTNVKNSASKTVPHGIMKPNRRETSWFMENLQKSKCGNSISKLIGQLLAVLDTQWGETSHCASDVVHKDSHFDFDKNIPLKESASSVFSTPNKKIEIIDLTSETEAHIQPDERHGDSSDIRLMKLNDFMENDLKRVLLENFQQKNVSLVNNSYCSSVKRKEPVLIKSRKQWDIYQAKKKKDKRKIRKRNNRKRLSLPHSSFQKNYEKKTRSGKVYYK